MKTKRYEVGLTATTKKYILHDIILIIAVILIISVFMLINHLTKCAGTYVSVVVDGIEVSEYPISIDAEIPINTEHGTNLLVIKDGSAFVSEASCRDLICVHHKPIKNKGETIVCLPHRVVIVVEGQTSSGIDAEG